METGSRDLYAFLGHLQRVTVDNQADITRLDRGLRIRRRKTKRSLMNDVRIKTCINRYDSGTYTPMQFLDAMRHNMDVHTAALNDHLRGDSDDRTTTTQTRMRHKRPITTPPPIYFPQHKKENNYIHNKTIAEGYQRSHTAQ